MQDSAAFDVLTAKIDALAKVCDQLGRENAELRGEVWRLSGGVPPVAPTTAAAGQPSADAVGQRSAATVGPRAATRHGPRAHARPGPVSRRGFGLSAIAGAAVAVLGSATLLAERGFRPAAGAVTAPAQDVGFRTTASATVALASGPSVVNAALGTSFAAVIGTNSAAGAGTGGVNTGSGPGVYGQAATGPGVYGTSHAGPGVSGYVDSSSEALSAVNSGTGPAINAVSGHGRGGVFGGSSVAQIQLSPGGSTHPASGSAGDFYVDHSARLWFCKGGKTWKQLA
ncbi:MAG TPA: hypothetical protein VMU95_34355 [Trebonia sp.]|nr:hypothetical protein [Trebonia sp.]